MKKKGCPEEADHVGRISADTGILLHGHCIHFTADRFGLETPGCTRVAGRSVGGRRDRSSLRIAVLLFGRGLGTRPARGWAVRTSRSDRPVWSTWRRPKTAATLAFVP